MKEAGSPDLMLLATDDRQPVAAAGVFTSNLMTAPPVLVSRDHLRASRGLAVGIVINSGNANAATGDQGRRDAEAMCAHSATQLGCGVEHVLVCSTGLIGFPLPMDAITTGISRLAPTLASTEASGADAAEAIRTTDTRRKEATVHRDGYVVGGMTKGAGMIAPNMATMLGVLTTDAAVDAATLADLLRAGVGRSFNRLSVDACQSTNDTVLVLASGRSGREPTGDELGGAIEEVCLDLAYQIAGDAEGHTKVVTVRVRGAVSDGDAELAARRVADSLLVKCAWYGEVPYWGRVASELGSSGARFEPDRLVVRYGPHTLVDGGVAAGFDETEVVSYLRQPDLEVTADLGLGDGSSFVITNDLTHAYVDENMGTS